MLVVGQVLTKDFPVARGSNTVAGTAANQKILFIMITILVYSTSVCVSACVFV